MISRHYLVANVLAFLYHIQICIGFQNHNAKVLPPFKKETTFRNLLPNLLYEQKTNAESENIGRLFPLVSPDPDKIEKEANDLNAYVKAPNSSGDLFGGLSVKRKESNNNREKILVSKVEGLNGIDPWQPFLFSSVAFGMSFLAGELSWYLAGNFAVQYLTSDLYPIQRATILARNIVVGITTLAAGFSGMIAVGLLFLGVAVVSGILKADLNPQKNEE